MKLGTIQRPEGSAVIVQIDENTAALVPGYRNLDDIVDQTNADWRQTAQEALASGERVALSEVSWLPPVRRPGKILGVALNNSANPGRIMSGPDTPAMFVKPASSMIGHGQPIITKPAYGRVHPEPELAVVIAKDGAEITVDEALDYVLGYTIINDITSPTMRDADTFHYRAIHPNPDSPDGIRYVDSWVSYPARYKGSDTFGPIGPWVVTTDEITDPHTLRITCSHEGRIITDDNTANLRFSVAEVISFASQYASLQAGDVIAMGTALKSSATGGAVQNLDLAKVGGSVEVAIEGIGELVSPVINR